MSSPTNIVALQRRSHPVVARVVGALVGVAAAKAVELLTDTVPGFEEHLEREAPRD